MAWRHGKNYFKQAFPQFSRGVYGAFSLSNWSTIKSPTGAANPIDHLFVLKTPAGSLPIYVAHCHSYVLFFGTNQSFLSGSGSLLIAVS
ncbi:hypothetical protein [Parasitella parasitica]|uniref:Uncharacterized protein n=1 Tax=Parasitella parasitica TaxID=35722 RepID=A0A0B7NNB6_9FUNG|nr:hypothetical protein [Parasitella parasitica]